MVSLRFLRAPAIVFISCLVLFLAHVPASQGGVLSNLRRRVHTILISTASENAPSSDSKFEDYRFLMKTLFVLACDRKHGMEVEARANTTAGTLDDKIEAMGDIHKQQIKEFNLWCQQTPLLEEKQCTDRCLKRVPDVAKRTECINGCTARWSGKFPPQCQEQSHQLKAVLDYQVAVANSRRQCSKTICPQGPADCKGADMVELEGCWERVSQYAEGSIKKWCGNLWDWFSKNDINNAPTY